MTGSAPWAVCIESEQGNPFRFLTARGKWSQQRRHAREFNSVEEASKVMLAIDFDLVYEQEELYDLNCKPRLRVTQLD
jgi:hypothetical protein